MKFYVLRLVDWQCNVIFYGRLKKKVLFVFRAKDDRFVGAFE
jgi:hypothetical protein